MKTQITLIRHGETSWNMQHRWQGHAPVPLNEVGRTQASETADCLKNARITRMVSSDLSRCLETAHIINRVLNVPLNQDKRLREIDVGRWQGLTSEEIQQWDSQTFEAYRQESPQNRVFPGGESFHQLRQRAIETLTEIVENYAGEHVLVVTHGGVIRGTLLGLLGVEPIATRIENCSLNRLLYENGIWQSNGVSLAAASVLWD